MGTAGELQQFEIQGVTYTWDPARDLMLLKCMPVATLEGALQSALRAKTR